MRRKLASTNNYYTAIQNGAICSTFDASGAGETSAIITYLFHFWYRKLRDDLGVSDAQILMLYN